MKRSLSILLSMLWMSLAIAANLTATDDPANETGIGQSVNGDNGLAYSDSLMNPACMSVREVNYDDSTLTRLKSELKRRGTRNVSGDNSHVPTSASVDTSKDIGEIPINPGISQAGAKTYDVPINLPSGMRGFQPRLSVSYDSHRGNSVLGKGWYISGLSTILRSGKSYYYDGEKVAAVNMDADDAFMLDGCRLILTNTHADHRLYETEFGNIKAKGHCTGDVIRYFEVFYPDGNKGIFGFPDSGENRTSYPLTSLSDLHGNRIEYTYNLSDNIYHISGIDYNGAAVEFAYTSGRKDPILAYSAGVRMSEDFLLDKITCRVDSTELCTYTFGYEYQRDSNRRHCSALLSEIGYSADNHSTNPLKFYYGTGADSDSFSLSQTLLVSFYSADNTDNIRLLRGRFEYNSTDDGLILLPNLNPYYKYSRNVGNDYFQNCYRGDEKIFLYTKLGNDVALPMPDMVTGNGFVDMLCADIKGQLEDHVIKINNYVENKRDKLVFTVYAPAFPSGLKKAYTRTYDNGYAHYDNEKHPSIWPKRFFTGDFNGDGKMEIMAITADGAFLTPHIASVCTIYDIDGDTKLYEGNLLHYRLSFIGESSNDPVEAANNSDRLFILDFDGDGKSDICHITDTGTYIYTFDIVGGKLTPRLAASDNTLTKYFVRDREVLCGEFNGDGLMDIIVSPSNKIESFDWGIYYSCGQGGFERGSFKGITRKDFIKDGFFVQDIDGDGKTDLVTYDESGFAAFLTRGNVPSTLISAAFEKNTRLVPSDINSPNGSCRLISLNDGIVTRYEFSGSTNMESLLTEVVRSHGVIERNRYVTLDDPDTGSGTFCMGADAVFPYVNIIESMPVIESTGTYTGGEPLEEWSYKYENAVLHRQGKGFCGFSKISSYRSLGGSVVREYAPYNFGVLRKETTPEVEIGYEYRFSTDANRISKANLISRIEKDLLRGFTATTSYSSHDTFGYPLLEECVHSDGSSVMKSYAYASSTEVEDGYNLGFLRESTTTISRGGRTYTERMDIPVYDRRLPKVRVLYKDGNQVEQVSTLYDAQGNPVSETVRRYSSPNSHTTRYTYDPLGRISSTTYPTGLSETFSYDPRGLLTSMRDIRGEKTAFGYDGFGRQTSVSYPDSTCRAVEYSWASANGSVYSISTRQTGRPDSTVYFDALDREVRCVEKRFDSSLKKTDRIYDRRGNLSKVSLPFKYDNPYAWDKFEYDRHDRLVRSDEATGKTTAYTYSGDSETEDDGQSQVTRRYDAFGNIISVTDLSGTVTYGYEPDGQLSGITAPGNITTTVEYDKFRRRKSVTDPSLGKVCFTYDASGNLGSRTDADGRTISYAYDTYNRLTKKMCDELTSTYEYDSYGQLKSVSADNGTGISYAYDSHGRVREVNEDGLDGVRLRTGYLYRSGNISAISYTSAHGRLATETYTYSNGHLREVILDNKTAIYRRNGENSYGQPTVVLTGTVTRRYVHTGFAFPHNRMVHTESDTLQDIGYVFDSKTGNMLSRTDNMRKIKESFSYDGANRLTRFGNIEVSYDSKGNILAKGDAGSLSYGIPGRPYAVSGLTPAEGVIPQDTQEISYTSFSRPSTIAEGDTRAEFDYNADGDRVRMRICSGGSTTLTRHYLGDRYECEKNGSFLHERLYLGGDAYSAPAVIESKSPLLVTDTMRLEPIGPPGPFQPANADISSADANAFPSSGLEMASIFGTRVYYLLRDCLGSVTHIVSSEGKVVQEFSYDAWGRFRDPDTHVVFPPDGQPTPKFGRGYTGHEHLPWFGLVNMNARLYDPLLGRFLSPDPNVQEPFWLQNLNRYSYAMNNPLCYIDEDGEFIQYILAAALFGGAINVINHWDEITSAGGWNSLWKGAGYFLVGGAAAGIGAAAGLGAVIGVGSMLGTTALTLSSTTASILTGAIYNGTRGFTEGLVLRTSNSMMQGVSFNNAISNAIEDAAMDGLTGAISGGTNNGTKSITKANQNLEDFYTQRGFYGYFGRDEQGIIRYVGITHRPVQYRFGEHLRSKTRRSLLDYLPEVSLQNDYELFKWEQTNINLYGLERNGGQLYNLKNSLAPRRWHIYEIKP